MGKKAKAAYYPPQLTAVSVRPERGFATSANLLVEDLQLIMLDQTIVGIDPSSQTHVEVYETGNGWNNGSNHFWD